MYQNKHFSGRNKLFVLIIILILLVSICISFSFFNFTADDSYILLRYAENFVNNGELSFNLGERINALTSPLHAVLTIILYFFTGKFLPFANKIVMAIFLLTTLHVLSRKYYTKPKVLILTFLAFLFSPFIQMWTFGGLETSLLLFLITLMTYVSTLQISRNNLYLISFLTGLSFITRFDSLIFTFPFLLTYFLLNYTLLGRLRTIFTAAILASFLPLLWLCFAFVYFKDILPTSFYLKIGSSFNFYTILYCFQFFIFSGVIPFYIFSISGIFLYRLNNVILKHIREYMHIYIALFCFTLYSFANANVHMMFGYRLLLPYLGAVYIIILHLLSILFSHSKKSISPVQNLAYAGLLTLFTVLQLVHCKYVYHYSLSGFSLTGEFRNWGIKDWNKLMGIMDRSAHDLENHINIYNTHKKELTFSTTLEGLIPYKINNIYVFGDLVSMRMINGEFTKNFTRNRNYPYIKNSDYIYIGRPFQNKIFDSLIQIPDKYQIISIQSDKFNDGEQIFYIFFNPNPQKILLPKYMRDLPAVIFQ